MDNVEAKLDAAVQKKGIFTKKTSDHCCRCDRTNAANSQKPT